MRPVGKADEQEEEIAAMIAMARAVRDRPAAASTAMPKSPAAKKKLKRFEENWTFDGIRWPLEARPWASALPTIPKKGRAASR